MASYTLTNKAVEDLSKIWSYTVEVWSETQADKYYKMLCDSFQDLADGKVSGRNYIEIRNDIFGFQIGKHLIFYRKLGENKIEIARIFHNRMDLRHRLEE
jgi:toxin ParE1/3/4